LLHQVGDLFELNRRTDLTTLRNNILPTPTPLISDKSLFIVLAN